MAWYIAMGLETVLLTSDANVIAQAIGSQLQVDQIVAELIPKDKLQRIKQLIHEGWRVATGQKHKSYRTILAFISQDGT